MLNGAIARQFMPAPVRSDHQKTKKEMTMTYSLKNKILAAAALAVTAGGLAVAPALANENGWFTGDRDRITAQFKDVTDAYGLGEVAFIERDDDEFKGYSRDAAGNTAEIELDLFGNLKEIEIEYARTQGFGAPGVGAYADEAGIMRNIETAGFEFLALEDRKKNHYEVLARTQNGDVAELRIGLDGQLHKAEIKPARFGSQNAWATGNEARGDSGETRDRGFEPRGR
jgi:hypothetical protein